MNLSKALLKVLPANFRAVYGDDMLQTMSAKSADQPRGWPQFWFWVRELIGVLSLSVRLHALGDATTSVQQTESIWSGRRPQSTALLFGLIGGVVFWLGGQLVGLHGIYWQASHPLAVAVVVILGCGLGWEMAAAHSRKDRIVRCTILACVMFAVLPAFRLADHFYLHRLQQVHALDFELPGISVRGHDLATMRAIVSQPHAEGFQATRYYAANAGGGLGTVWFREPGAPPYLWLGVLLMLTSNLGAHALRMRLAR